MTSEYILYHFKPHLQIHQISLL